MAVFKGKAFIFGVRYIRPIVNIPPEALRVRVKMRCNSPAYAFVKFPDRIEKHYIFPADECTLACPEWKISPWAVDVNYAPTLR